jgi:hypothetical protein
VRIGDVLTLPVGGKVIACASCNWANGAGRPRKRRHSTKCCRIDVGRRWRREPTSALPSRKGSTSLEIMSEAGEGRRQQPPWIKALNPFGRPRRLVGRSRSKLGDLGEGPHQADGCRWDRHAAAVLSAPGVQTSEGGAREGARAMANDRLRRRPASIPIVSPARAIAPQNPDKAAQELQRRCVAGLRVRGDETRTPTANISTTRSTGRSSNVPPRSTSAIYIHPRDPRRSSAVRLGYPGSSWAGDGRLKSARTRFR